MKIIQNAQSVKRKIAVFQMDALESLNPTLDSTMLLIREGLKRNYNCYCYLPQDLRCSNGIIFATVTALYNDPNSRIYLTKGEQLKNFNLKQSDLLFIRQDPPFNIGYISLTYLLDFIKNDVIILSNPTSLRDNPEKLLVQHLKQHIPPTLIARTRQPFIDFFEEHKTIVLKPSYSFGGQNVMKINSHTTLDAYLALENFAEPLIAQPYLEEVTMGDVRIIITKNQIIGSYKRIPLKGDFRTNMAMGGVAKPHILDSTQQKIAQDILKILNTKNIFLAGVDLIGHFLIEINITSPTGLTALNQLYSMKSENIIWNEIEQLL